MFHTCLHCQRDLGSNDAIEHFAVGHRIAYDGEKGRLWAVCRRCERWNLAPFDARWEALDECERAFRNTRVRISTDNIGLARLRDGTELVRIGRPMRPEFAAWRYGDQFGRRRVRAISFGAVGVGAAALAVGGLAHFSVGAIALLPVIQLANFAALAATQGLDSRPMPNPGGGYFYPYGRPKLVQRADVEEGWGLEIGYMHLADNLDEDWRKYIRNKNEVGRLQIRGAEAMPLLRRVLPRVNRGGASKTVVSESVALIEQAGDPANFGKWAAERRREWGARQAIGDTGDLQHIPRAARLAFEMAIFEEDERRALQGELATLERAWEDAERIAAIADTLHLPGQVEQKLDEMKKRR